MEDEFANSTIQQISKSNPEHPRAYYVQARYFEEYAARYDDPQYRTDAIKAYRKTLEMHMNISEHGIPARVAEDAIRRLTEMGN